MALESADGTSYEENFLRPVTDPAGISACYEKYGVVGVTGVLTPTECQNLIQDGLQPFLSAGCDFRDPATFDKASVNRFGVIGKHSLFNAPILQARLHQNVAIAYQAAYQRGDIYACHDRAAWMRPTARNPQWDTPFAWPGLHFDISPTGFHDEAFRPQVEAWLRGLNYGDLSGFVGENSAKHASMGRTIQGVLNLLDNEEEDGGFHCVPGMFEDKLRAWVEEHSGLPAPEANGRYNFKPFGPDAEVGAEAVRVPCPAGTLLLFDATLPHGTRRNASTQSRMILFLRYLTMDSLPREVWKERNAALRRICRDCGFDPDDRQASLLYRPEEKEKEPLAEKANHPRGDEER